MSHASAPSSLPDTPRFICSCTNQCCGTLSSVTLLCVVLHSRILLFASLFLMPCSQYVLSGDTLMNGLSLLTYMKSSALAWMMCAPVSSA